MDENKVIEYLKEDDKVSKNVLITNIERRQIMGELVIDLLIKAENGDFHEYKKPEMVQICDTKYAYYKNNYDNCIREELIGCKFCEYYVPKHVLELFEKFEKEGFPKDETLKELFG